ncbi:hypothetical protein DPMN_097888 [Dreissena polymorpha]|uniref:Uncharacterized protein n=1 Tax=Dreissena polymorpha TaxID=45954 RepID=A0A9D4LB21_DREPO|nr:hypothetical protein DPMN_097888 [Dreissena polymorpha]
MNEGSGILNQICKNHRSNTYYNIYLFKCFYHLWIEVIWIHTIGSDVEDILDHTVSKHRQTWTVLENGQSHQLAKVEKGVFLTLHIVLPE